MARDLAWDFATELAREQGVENLARHCQERGLINSKISPEEFGKVIFGLLPGYVLQALVAGDISAATYAAAVSGSILQVR